MHIAFYSKAVKISSKPFPSLASADGDESKQTLATRQGESMILRETAATWPVPAARRETGLRPPGKPECFQHSQGAGWAPGEEVQSARQGRTNCHRLCPSCCFSNEGSALGHWKVPKSTPRQRYSTADIQPSRGTAQVGFKYDFVSGEGRSKHSLGGMAQATGLAVLPHSTAPEPGSSLAWRHALPSSGDKESKPGGPQQGSGLPRQSRLESQPRGTACSSGGSA